MIGERRRSAPAYYKLAQCGQRPWAPRYADVGSALDIASRLDTPVVLVAFTAVGKVVFRGLVMNRPPDRSR